MQSQDGIKVSNLRISGSIFEPNKRETIFLEPIRPVKGFGRWVYCKYCYKNVKPMLSGINQIICSKCGAGLTPDFFKLENLKRWLSGDDSATKDDMNSPEAKAWLEKKKLERK